jgi:signal transduction histidine kinase
VGNRDLAAQKPFGLVTYYSVTSLVIILLFSLFIAYLVSQRTSDLTLAKREQYALLLAENLNHQVMTRFVAPIMEEYGRINVGQPAQYKLMDAVVNNTIHSFQVRKVNILDLEGTIIYSTDPHVIARTGYDSTPFQEAVIGGHTSVLTPRPNLLEFGGTKQRLLHTFIPLRDERRLTSELGRPLAVFEIILDLTDDFKEVWLNQLLVVSALLVMMALLFVILRSIVKRGQRIMDERTKFQIQLEEKLSQSERLAALGRMIAGVAHEIRNPLGIVRSTAELLGKRTSANNQPLAEVIVEESTRLNRIVTEFLDFARPQAPHLRPLSLEEVVEHNLATLEAELDRNRIRVVRRQENKAEVMGDPDLLYRAFLNIFNNAIQAMENQPGGSLLVATSSARHNDKPMVCLSVSDSGPGVDAEAAGRLFDPFFTTRENGSGLGLSIVGSIISSHQGSVDIKNRPEGGARVEVWLPAAVEDKWSGF